MIDAGPVNYMAPTEDGEHVTEARSLDPTKLLVTAWEERVFPVIRRRFRSDSDRRSGLEQIRGALLAGKESHTLYSPMVTDSLSLTMMLCALCVYRTRRHFLNC